MEKQLDDMSTTLKFMQEMMLKNGLFKANEDSADKTVKDKQKSEYETNLSNSETTIYHKAVLPDNIVVQGNETIDNERGQSTDNIQVDPEITFKLNQDANNSNENIQINRRESSSSEEHIDTSDELLDVDKFIADCQESVRRRTQDDKGEQHLKKQVNQADQIIKDAEENKARMLATPGNCQINFPVIHNQLEPGQINAPLMAHQHATLVDENYLVIGGHVDEALRVRIVNHEYIDFARLLPKDRLSREEDNRMELISKSGSMYFVLVADREVNGSISNFTRWEQAFRVYSNIYTRTYPTRVTELIQYNHLIYTASLSFIWENVYRYDKEFRLHMSNYPQRNWGIILQQVWSVYLKDRVSYHRSDESGPKSAKRKEICKHFNKGKCTNGFKCSYDHRCLNCGKFGHSAHICRNKKSTEDTPVVSTATNTNNGALSTTK